MLTAFWLLASIMLGVALALVLPALLRPRAAVADGSRSFNVAVYRQQRAELDAELADGRVDEQTHREAVADLERGLLADVAQAPDRQVVLRSPQPLPAVATALLLPALAFGMYFTLGSPRALDGTPPAAAPATPAPARAAAPGADDPPMPHSVEEMVAGLRTRLQEQPGDADGWVMLGRSLASLNRLEQASEALAEANRLRPQHPLTLTAWAEVAAGMNGNRLDGQPLAMLERALAVDPDFPRALWLAGVAYYRAGEPERAVEHWRRLQRLGLDPQGARQVAEAIAAAGGSPDAPPALAPAGIDVQVRLAPELAGRVAPGDTLFVFARAAEGPRMPLAIVRTTAAALPLTVTLDDSQAMTPQFRLSGFDEVVVGARVSRSGNATPASGDLAGSAGVVGVHDGARAEVVIAEVLP